MPQPKEVLLIVASYVLGCFTSGYYLVLWQTGRDIRNTGSTSAGATNVSRVLGSVGFALTFVIDCIKGAMAVWMAQHFHLQPGAVILIMIAVVAGHLWPIQLGFHGGKGIATGTGALLAYNYSIVLILLGFFLILLIPLRNHVLAGLAAFAVIPLALWSFGFPLSGIVGTAILSALILLAHRRNIPEELEALICSRRTGSARHEKRGE